LYLLVSNKTLKQIRNNQYIYVIGSIKYETFLFQNNLSWFLNWKCRIES